MRNIVENTIRKSVNAVKVGAVAMALVSIAQSAQAGEYWAASAPVAYKLASPTAPVAGFDQSRINKTLAAHQTVGNPYTVQGKTYTPKHQPDYDMVGTASWYGDKFHGKTTVSGEAYNKNDFTAAHKTLPLGSLVVLTNLQSGQSVTLRINDRGPFVGERVIDVSEAAARALGMSAYGLESVRVQYAGPAEAKTAALPQQTRPAPQFDRPMTVSPQASLPSQQVAIPEAYMPQADGNDQTVTMTIKGPIHMAKSGSGDAKPRLIKAVNRTTYKSKN